MRCRWLVADVVVGACESRPGTERFHSSAHSLCDGPRERTRRERHAAAYAVYLAIVITRLTTAQAADVSDVAVQL